MAGPQTPQRPEEVDYRDRKSWETERGTRQAEVRREVASQALARLRQAEVPFDRLTGDPNWDFYLSLLQDRLEVRRSSLKRMQEFDLALLSYDHAGLAVDKAARQIQYAVIQEIEAILAIPKMIREAGQEAARVAFPADPSK